MTTPVSFFSVIVRSNFFDFSLASRLLLLRAAKRLFTLRKYGTLL